MRRKDREVTDIAVVEDILKRAAVVHLGMAEGGKPYVVPMHYGYTFQDGVLILYMHGAHTGKKYDIIRENPNVFIEIDADMELISGDGIPCEYGASYASVMGEGVASILEDVEEKKQGLKILMKTQTGQDFEFTEAMCNTVQVIKIEVPVWSAKCSPKA